MPQIHNDARSWRRSEEVFRYVSLSRQPPALNPHLDVVRVPARFVWAIGALFALLFPANAAVARDSARQGRDFKHQTIGPPFWPQETREAVAAPTSVRGIQQPGPEADIRTRSRRRTKRGRRSTHASLRLDTRLSSGTSQSSINRQGTAEPVTAVLPSKQPSVL